MDFTRLVALAADLHCFSPGLIAAGEPLDQVRVQLSRWVHSGKVLRLCKGWYVLNEPFRRARVDMFVVASTVKPGSYVSLQSALSFHGMIPEYVAETTCVTTGRPVTIHSPLGRIGYRHVKTSALFGYTRHDGGSQHAFVATPEKALLDLLYLTPGSDDPDYLSELRLQAIDELDIELIRRMGRRLETPRVDRAVDAIARLIAAERELG